MQDKKTMWRRPEDIVKSLKGRIRSLKSTRFMLETEVLPPALAAKVSQAVEHLRFLEADLLIDLDNFIEEHGLEKRQKNEGF